MRIAGTACVVPSPTVLVFANQVEPAASAAKFGKRTASMRPCASRSELIGSSSKATRITGAFACSPAASALSVPENVSREASECSRKSPRKSSGAGASTVRTSRAPASRT